jgi:hypothetical protein
MPESGTFGSVRGVSGNGHPYRNPGSRAVTLCGLAVMRHAGTKRLILSTRAYPDGFESDGSCGGFPRAVG